MKKIIVKNNEEYKVRIISKPNKEEFIYPYFVQASKELKEIIDDTKKYYSKDKKTILEESNDFSNNIIAFSGNRGQGKSSAMLSFSKFLINIELEENRDLLGEDVCGCNYLVLDRIDPTKFEIGDNILTVILAKIFHEFCNLWNDSDKSDVALRTELLESFQSCYREIDTVKNHNNSNAMMCSDLERLGRIGDSANLKDHLMQLLNNFFEFKCRIEGKTAKKDYFLIIQLDDTDLNTEKAYHIVEDVRKYFMIPNVVVLMAVDLTLMTYSIEQMYMKQFEIYERISSSTRISEYHQMAVKYIDKLIPGNRKIFLPSVKSSSDEYGNQVTIEYMDSRGKNLLSFKDNNGDDIEDVQELLLRLIFEKTGLIFIKPNRYQHSIVPDTMRELVNFLSILNRMDDMKNSFDDKNDLKIRLNNLQNFESFFINIWIVNHITDTFNKAIYSFINASWNNKNKQIIKDIEAIFKTSLDYDFLPILQNEIDKVLDESAPISLADVRSVLSSLEDAVPKEEVFNFTFAIKTLYSILLNKLIFNQLLQDITKEAYDNELVMNIIGGDIFGNAVNSFVRTKNGKYSRSDFKVEIAHSKYEELIKNHMNVIDSAYIAAVFCNFTFPSSDGESVPAYEEKYIRTSNNTRSYNWVFNISYPFMYLIQPKKILERITRDAIESNMNVKTPKGIEMSKYSCIQIVSNLDFMAFLEKNLKKTYLSKTDGWDFTRYIVDFFERTYQLVKNIKYIPINNDWTHFINYIDENKTFLNAIQDTYIEDAIDFDYSQKRFEYERVIKSLNTFKNTRTVEVLMSKCESLSDRLFEIHLDYDSLEVEMAMADLSDLMSEISEQSYLNEDEVIEYQRKLNAIVKELKESV